MNANVPERSNGATFPPATSGSPALPVGSVNSDGSLMRIVGRSVLYVGYWYGATTFRPSQPPRMNTTTSTSPVEGFSGVANAIREPRLE